jgi:hypothetical protein
MAITLKVPTKAAVDDDFVVVVVVDDVVDINHLFI